MTLWALEREAILQDCRFNIGIAPSDRQTLSRPMCTMLFAAVGANLFHAGSRFIAPVKSPRHRNFPRNPGLFCCKKRNHQSALP